MEQKKLANTAAERGHGGKAESVIAAEHGSDAGQPVAKPARVRRKVSLAKSSNGAFLYIPAVNAAVTQDCLNTDFCVRRVRHDIG